MYRHKLLNPRPANATAEKLQSALLEYHDFRIEVQRHPLQDKIISLAAWQSQRLKHTHYDLYQLPAYKNGLSFLLEDLYAPKDFSQRDNDIDRIYPTMVKLLPETLLYTVATLVELNLLSKKLDLALAQVLFEQMEVTQINDEHYAHAYRICDNEKERLHQIQLIANIGDDLDRYVHSKFLNFTLKITQKPAEMAGVGALHNFLLRGFQAFKSMDSVDLLLERIIERETCLLKQIYNQHPTPLKLPSRFTNP
jgi:hypothetical protein